jgi:hypothetical protein
MLVLLMGGSYEFAVEMGSDGMLYTKFHKDWFRHSKVVRGETQTDTQTTK